MKKLIVCFVLLATLLAACTVQTDDVNAGTHRTSGGNFTDEMKIPYDPGQDLEEYAQTVRKDGETIRTAHIFPIWIFTIWKAQIR